MINGRDLDHFRLYLTEDSIIQEAQKLSEDIEKIKDNPELMLSAKYDKTRDAVKKILSKTGVKNLKELLPLYEAWKEIQEFKISDEDTQVYFLSPPKKIGHLMKGGELIIKGNAGDYAGREMKGGEIIIDGNIKSKKKKRNPKPKPKGEPDKKFCIYFGKDHALRDREVFYGVVL